MTENTYANKRTAFLLALERPKPLIIFCGTRRKSEDMARELAAYYGNDKVKFYHAGMEREEKTKVEKWFYPKTDAILCCTCAFGMGVERIANLKYRVSDLREFSENDVRFLEQFKAAH